MGGGSGESEEGARKVTKMRKGLTLMELLTVISILATLAALLFPVYLKVRSRVYQTSCANQLRQIGIAIHMYANDHGDGTPYSMPYPMERIYPSYITDRDFLICPRIRALVPSEILEEFRHLKIWGSPLSSYWAVAPKGIDALAKEYPGEFVSFADVFAKRGDMTPIVICEFHRYCAISTFNFPHGSKGFAWAQVNCYDWRHDIFFTPGAPLLILRWGGMVDFVYKGTYWFPSHSTSALLLDF
jgi:prepilin-type N-terminal cleavage/methylation domain-containing protein